MDVTVVDELIRYHRRPLILPEGFFPDEDRNLQEQTIVALELLKKILEESGGGR